MADIEKIKLNDATYNIVDATAAHNLTDIAQAGTGITFTDVGGYTTDYTTVGSPTISADYVVSGFSSSNYLTKQLPSVTSSFVFYSKVYAPAVATSSGSYPYTFSVSDSNSGWGLAPNWSGYSGKCHTIFGLSGNATVDTVSTFNDAWVWVAVVVTSTSAYMYTMVDPTGSTYTVDTLPDVSDPRWTRNSGYSSANKLSVVSGKLLYIGVNNYQNKSCGNYSIDMVNTKYIIDGTTTWYGVTHSPAIKEISTNALQNAARGNFREKVQLISAAVSSGTISLSQPYTDFDGLLVVSNSGGSKIDSVFISKGELDERRSYNATWALVGGTGERYWICGTDSTDSSFTASTQNCTIQMIYGINF